MTIPALYNTYKRYRTLQTHRISSLPIVILMPHSACNCRCVMCDIWKGNQHLQQLGPEDVKMLLISLKRYGTQQVLMSGGEALLHRNFFTLCRILKQEKIKVSLLSTGLALKRHAVQITQWVDEVIVSVDGDGPLHDAIRNIPGAFAKMKEGIAAIRALQPGFAISGRSVIHKLNYRQWPDIIKAAKQLGLDQISFLPADVSSHAFNREDAWSAERQYEVTLAENDLRGLKDIIDDILVTNAVDIQRHFIAENGEKLKKIYEHYAAFYGLGRYPLKKCNAPWVSVVIEADGAVRPCFFHQAYGNLKTAAVENIVNSPGAIEFRRNLDIDENDTCKKCVCYLNLSPAKKII